MKNSVQACVGSLLALFNFTVKFNSDRISEKKQKKSVGSVFTFMKQSCVTVAILKSNLIKMSDESTEDNGIDELRNFLVHGVDA